MDLPAPPSPRRPLPGAIAIVGCDGAGKSTLAADLLARLRAERRAELIYLGQDSGNIARAIGRAPVLGAALARYLRRRSGRAHARGDAPAAPDALTALVIHALSRWRHHKFRRAVALGRQGAAVITDRYPQAEVPGFHFDGPGLVAGGGAGLAVRLFAARERRLYRRMAGYVPALVIRLDIDADTAHARKPDHKLATLRDKARVLPTLAFNGARIVALDARRPYPEVFEAALAAARDALSAPGSRSAAG